MEIREATSDDSETIREVAERSFTQSYALSPEQIEILLESEFGNGESAAVVTEGPRTVLVAEDDGELVGFAEYEIDGETATIHWLHVEPTAREQDVGTRLFEAVRDAFDDADATQVRALTLEENSEGRGFFEAFDFVREGEHHREVGGESFAEYVFVPAAQADDDGPGEAEAAEKADVVDAEGSETADEDASAGIPEDMEVPETVTTDDGQTVYVSADDAIAAESGPLFAVYTDEAREEQYAYYCTNCGSLATAGDATGRIECETCGNTHEPDEDYDAGYL
jgi:ribosomal protein S18 acetylase RimI-like enzyme